MSFDEKDFLNPDANMDLSGDGEERENSNLTLNLENASDELPKIEPLPPGIYDCIFENVEFIPVNNSGNPMLTFQLKVIDERYENRMLFYHTVLNKDSGLTRLKQLLVRCAPDVDLRNFNPQKFADEGEILGFACRAKVNVRPYKGEKRNNVTEILAPEESPTGFLDE